MLENNFMTNEISNFHISQFRKRARFWYFIESWDFSKNLRISLINIGVLWLALSNLTHNLPNPIASVLYDVIISFLRLTVFARTQAFVITIIASEII